MKKDRKHPKNEYEAEWSGTKWYWAENERKLAKVFFVCSR